MADEHSLNADLARILQRAGIKAKPHNCKVQLAIDKAICKHTGFPEKLCRQARHLLSHEPMVTGQRYQANPEPTNPELF